MAAAFIIQNCVTSLVLNVIYSGGPGSPVIMYPYQKTANELWVLDNCTIRSLVNGLVLDINVPTTSGSQVIAARPCGSPTQLWKVEPEGYLRNNNGLVLTVWNSDPSPSTTVTVAPSINDNGQHFRLVYHPC